MEEFELKADEISRPTQEELAPVDDKKEVIDLPHVLDLAYPVELTQKNTVSSITFRHRIRGSFMEHLPVDTGKGITLKLGHFYPIISGMTGETITLLRKMDRADIMKAINVVEYFL